MLFRKCLDLQEICEQVTEVASADINFFEPHDVYPYAQGLIWDFFDIIEHQGFVRVKANGAFQEEIREDDAYEMFRDWITGLVDIQLTEHRVRKDYRSYIVRSVGELIFSPSSLFPRSYSMIDYKSAIDMPSEQITNYFYHKLTENTQNGYEI